ncbi:DNA-binding response regulator [Ornithinimicrobium sp. Y1847]|uniref:response regulator transcription factor n=1 Tax=Ornithinimicrobium sp. Y1847 TaxID=3405419 RepID=UPI003B67EF97
MSGSASDRPLRVAILNDYEVVVRGLHAMLAPYQDRVEVVELDVQVPVVAPVDITLYDTFSETQVDAADIDEVLESKEPGAVVVYTWNMHPQLVEVALAKGCRGYLDKSLSAPALLGAIERVARGDIVVSATHTPANAPYAEITEDDDEDGSRLGGDWPGRAEKLSAREAEVISLITQGLTNSDIAARTYLSINSVKTYIRTAYRKMGVSRRAQAVRWGLEHGMAPDTMRISNPSAEKSLDLTEDDLRAEDQAEQEAAEPRDQAGTKTTEE